MKKIFGICMLAMALVISGCGSKSKPDTSKEFIKSVLEYAQTPPAEGTPDETIANYEKWLDEAHTKFKKECNESFFDILDAKVFPAIAVAYEGYEMPAEVNVTEVEEKAGDSYYATVELKDKAGTAFKMKVRVQFKDDKINFMEVM